MLEWNLSFSSYFVDAAEVVESKWKTLRNFSKNSIENQASNFSMVLRENQSGITWQKIKLRVGGYYPLSVQYFYFHI